MSRRRKKSKIDKSKGIYILPNLLTTASLFAGFYSIVSTFNGEFMPAAVAIIISGVFDGLDGKVARMTKSTSQFGVEYDSLADLVAFGVAPGLLAYVWALQPFGRLGWVAGFIFMACGALRLARFNVYAPTKSQIHFQGLPIPAAAGMVAATVFFFNFFGKVGPTKHVSVLILLFCLSYLMVSNIQYFSLKDPDLLKSRPFNAMVTAVLVLALVAVQPRITIFVLGLCYLISGPVLTYKLKQKEKEARENFESSPAEQETTGSEL